MNVRLFCVHRIAVYRGTVVADLEIPILYQMSKHTSKNNKLAKIGKKRLLEDIKAEERSEILLVLNELNQNKRWGKFYLEENGSVSLLASLLSSKCEIDSADVYELAVMVKATVDSLKSKFS